MNDAAPGNETPTHGSVEDLWRGSGRRRAGAMLGALVLGATCPWTVRGAGPARVAWVSNDAPRPDHPGLVAFRDAMKAAGWTDGGNLIIEPWWTGGGPEVVRQILPQIAERRPDVVVVTNGLVLQALIDAKLPMPLVFMMSADPVQAGVVQSLARPGVNRTGFTQFSVELVPKRIELIREMLPAMKRLAIVGWPPHAGEPVELQAARTAAERLGLAYQYHGVETAADLDAAFDGIGRWSAEAILVLGGPVATNWGPRFADYAVRRRVPSISSLAAFADQGNVMSYGPVTSEMHRRMAAYVHRILNGTAAAELPVEGPTRIELVLNLKAARAIGIAVPQSIRLRADRTIE